MEKSRGGGGGGGNAGSVGGRLKSRLAQILLRSSCSTTTTNSTTAYVSLSKNQEPPSPSFCTPCPRPRPKLDKRRLRRAAPLVHISIDCARGGASGRRSFHSDTPLLPLPVKDEKKSKSKACSPTSKRYYSSREYPSRRAVSKPSDMKEIPNLLSGGGYAYSCSSSTVTDNELAPFSSDDERGEEAETRTLFSSISFSSDSSEFYNNTRRSRRSKPNCRRQAPRRRVSRTTSKESTKPEADTVDAFRPLVSVASKDQKKDKKEDVKEKEKAAKENRAGAGMAVVKRSSNPYADFRSSMVEMIVEQRISSIRDLEKLLGSYLSLNSPRHHPAILAAFEDVWEAIFGEE